MRENCRGEKFKIGSHVFYYDCITDTTSKDGGEIESFTKTGIGSDLLIWAKFKSGGFRILDTITPNYQKNREITIELLDV